MSTFKRILVYFIWSLIAFLSAFVYVRIILGPKPESSSTFMVMFGWLYEYAFIYIGLIIGSIIALLFILIDLFYLKNKFKIGISSLFIRFFIIIFITVFVGSIHYILELCVI
jgi:hypothetical protein